MHALPTVLAALAVTASVVGLGGGAAQAEPAAELDLAGSWRLALDPDAQGVAAQWYRPDQRERFAREARLPGSLDEQRIGDPVSLATPWVGDWERSGYRTDPRYAPYRPPHEVKLPFWLTPDTHYVGPAWYRRTVRVPDAWRGRRVTLQLERCHWTTAVWIDGQAVGRRDSLSAPHEYDVTDWARPGEREIVVCVDNRVHVHLGPNSHSISDHTQGNWNGVVGQVRLAATPRIWIDRVRVRGDAREKTFAVEVALGNRTGRAAEGALTASVLPRGDAQAGPWQSSLAVTSAGAEQTVRLEVRLPPDSPAWDEFAPALYDIDVVWRPTDGERSEAHAVRTTSGLRDVSVQGSQIAVNGRPVFLRGALDCCLFPKTGYPPTDLPSWRRLLQTCRAYGLNHLRFHSYCPPEAAFLAADELGVYLQPECANWANQGASLGDGGPVDQYVYDETQRILDAYGHHPSFLLFACGNEPSGRRHVDFLSQWIRHFSARDPQRLYTGGSGWPVMPANQFHVSPAPRIQAWGAGLRSRINARPPETVSDYAEFVRAQSAPVIAHEIGQWCAFPNLDERRKYVGHLKAKNFDIFADWLEAAGLGRFAHDFFLASGKLQTLCYKEEIESALRTPGFGGFQLLGLSDFAGQGTALVGVLDAFWEAKPYVAADEYRRFCDSVVPLAKLPRRTYRNDDVLTFEAALANYGPRPLTGTAVTWSLVAKADAAVLARGALRADADTGAVTSFGSVETSLADVHGPTALRLELACAETGAHNSWDLWVYPAQSAEPSLKRSDGLLIATDADDAVLATLDKGGVVLLTLPADRVNVSAVLGFSSIFWNTLWTENQPPHTLGVLCDPQHPLFAEFPTEFHSNWQWWELIHGAAAMDVTDIADQVTPVVRVAPDWFRPRALALVCEARLGRGKLLITSAKVAPDRPDCPAADQFRRSLIDYATSDAFQPTTTLTPEALQTLIRPPR
ncbi:MAG: glycoside hydrolase family 2 [Pirellulales bacterium]|nr:glycoside hydrolase family 2 [Pirellulales bacterium]